MNAEQILREEQRAALDRLVEMSLDDYRRDYWQGRLDAYSHALGVLGAGITTERKVRK